MRKFVESILVVVFLVLISSVSFGCPSQGDDPDKEKKYEKACPYGDAVLVWKKDTDISEDSMCITYDAGKKAFMSYDYDWNKNKIVYPAKEYPVNQWSAFTMEGELLPMANGKIKVYTEQDEVMQKEADMKVADMYDEHWK